MKFDRPIKRTLKEKYEVVLTYEKLHFDKGAKTKIVKEFNLAIISSLNPILSVKDEIKEKYLSNFPVERAKDRMN